MQSFDNVIYLTFMMGIMSLIFKFIYKMDTISIDSIWWLVGGAWIGAIVVYLINR